MTQMTSNEEKIIKEFWNRVVEATPEDMTPGEGYKIVSDEDLKWLLQSQKERVVAMCEEMKRSEEPDRLGNPTFPYARRDASRSYNQALSDLQKRLEDL